MDDDTKGLLIVCITVIIISLITKSCIIEDTIEGNKVRTKVIYKVVPSVDNTPSTELP